MENWVKAEPTEEVPVSSLECPAIVFVIVPGVNRELYSLIKSFSWKDVGVPVSAGWAKKCFSFDYLHCFYVP